MEGARDTLTSDANAPTFDMSDSRRKFYADDLLMETDEVLIFPDGSFKSIHVSKTLEFSNPKQMPFEIVQIEIFDMAPNRVNNAWYLCPFHHKFEKYPIINSILNYHWQLVWVADHVPCEVHVALGESHHPYESNFERDPTVVLPNEKKFKEILQIRSYMGGFAQYIRMAREIALLSRKVALNAECIDIYKRCIRNLVIIDENHSYTMSARNGMRYEHICQPNARALCSVRCTQWPNADELFRGFHRQVPHYRRTQIAPGCNFEPITRWVSDIEVPVDPWDLTPNVEQLSAPTAGFEQHADHGVWDVKGKKKIQKAPQRISDNVKNSNTTTTTTNRDITASEILALKTGFALWYPSSKFELRSDFMQGIDRNKFFSMRSLSPDVSKWGTNELVSIVKAPYLTYVVNVEFNMFKRDVFSVLSHTHDFDGEYDTFVMDFTSELTLLIFNTFREDKVTARTLYVQLLTPQWSLKTQESEHKEFTIEETFPFEDGDPADTIWSRVTAFTTSIRSKVVDVLSSVFTDALGQVVGEQLGVARDWFVDNKGFLVQTLLDGLTLGYCYREGWSDKALVLLTSVILRHMFPSVLDNALEHLCTLFSKPFEQQGSSSSTNIWLLALSGLAIMAKIFGVIVTMKQLIMMSAVIAALDRVASHSDDVLEFLIANLPAAMGAWLRPLLSYDPVRKLTFDVLTFDMNYSSMRNAETIQSHNLSKFVKDYHDIQVAFRELHKKATNNDCNTIRTTLKKYEAAYHNAVQRIGVGGDRVPSVWIYMFGVTGVGKTEIVSRICRELAPELFPAYYDVDTHVVDIQGLKYARQLGQKFWNGYSGQPIVYVDDFGSVREDPFPLETLLMCGCDTFLPNMASLNDPGVGVKGTPYTSELIITTSNSVNFVHNELTNMQAVMRRRNVIVEVAVNKQVYNSHTGTVDEALLLQHYPDIEDMKVSWPHMEFRLHHPTVKQVQAPEKILTFRQFVAHIIGFIREHREKTLRLSEAKKPLFYMEKIHLSSMMKKQYDAHVEAANDELCNFNTPLYSDAIVADLSVLKVPVDGEVKSHDFEQQGKDDKEFKPLEKVNPDKRRVINFAHKMGEPNHQYCAHTRCTPKVMYTGALKMFSKYNPLLRTISEIDEFGMATSSLPLTPRLLSSLWDCMDEHNHQSCAICLIHLDHQIRALNDEQRSKHLRDPTVAKPLSEFFLSYLNAPSRYDNVNKMVCEKFCYCVTALDELACPHCIHCEICRFNKLWLRDFNDDTTVKKIKFASTVINFFFKAAIGYFVLKKTIQCVRSISTSLTDIFAKKDIEDQLEMQSSDHDKLLERKEKREHAIKKRGEKRAEKQGGAKHEQRTGGKQQGRFQTYYKNGKQYTEPRPDYHQHASDGLSNRLQKLLCQITVVDKDTGQVESGGCWRVSGRMIACTAHYFENLSANAPGKNCDIMITLPNTSRTQYSCDIKNCKFYRFVEFINEEDEVEIDFVAVLLPDDAPVATDNMALFVKEEHLDYINTGQMGLFGLNSTFNKLFLNGVTNVKRIKTPVGGVDDRYLLSGWAYNSPMAVSGWCTFPLVDFSRDNGCIVGAHSGKYKGSTIHRAEMITYEMMYDAWNYFINENTFVQESLPSWVQENKAANFMPPDGVEYLGAVANVYAVQLPNKTQFDVSPLSAVLHEDVPWQKPVKEPAILSSKDPRHKTEHSPLYNAIDGYQCSGHVASDVVDIAVNICDMELAGLEPGMSRVLTESEAINGIDGGELYFQKLDMTTSPGYPYVKMRQAGEVGKEFLFDKDDVGCYHIKPGSILRRRLDEAHMKMSKCIIPGDAWATDVLKDEKLKLQKIADSNTRLFNVLPVCILILEKMYYGAFNAFYIRNHVDHHGSVGLNPRSMEWDLQYKMMCEVGRKCGIDGDIAKWDKVSPTQAEEAFLKVVENWYKRNDAQWSLVHENIRRALSIWRNHCTHIAHDAIYRTHGGTISGSLLTGTGNCIKNNFFHVCAFIELIRGTPLRTVQSKCLDLTGYTYASLWKKHVRLKDWGDDVIISVSEVAYPYYNGNTISKWWKDLGITYTPSDKCSTFVKKDVCDLEYLKAYTQIDPKTGIAYPRFARSQVDEMLNWVRVPNVKNGTIYEQAVLNCDACLQFLMFEGRMVFNEYRDAMCRLLSGSTVFYLPTFDEYVTALIENEHYPPSLRTASWVIASARVRASHD
jgi:hypothetical protein